MPPKTTDTAEYMRVVDGYVEIRQKVGKGHLSSTGKNNVVISTGGFTAMTDTDVRVNLTAIRPLA